MMLGRWDELEALGICEALIGQHKTTRSIVQSAEAWLAVGKC